MKRYYTYAYLREDKTPYYIGKGKGQRAFYRYPKERIRRPKDKSRILILKHFDNEEDAFKHERYMIAVLGKKADGGILHNLCDGGEGTSCPKTEEHKRKIAESNRGVKRSIHTRKRMSKSAVGKPKSAEHKAHIGATLKGKPWSKARRDAYEARKK